MPNKDLSELMEFGRVIRSYGDTSVDTEAHLFDRAIPAPEETQYVDLDENGGAPDPVAPKGWEYLTGFTGQYSYNGPVMHESEYIGGRLAEHILSNAGYYAAVEIDGYFPDDREQEPAVCGWAVLHYINNKVGI